MKAKYVEAGGLNTRYLFAGTDNDKALLLIHGGGIAADSWMCNIDELAKTFAVYAPDTVGHGFTDAVDLGGDLPQPHALRHLIAFLDAVGIDKFYAGGSSYGALLAGLLYLEIPERVEKLVLISSSSAFDSDEDYRKAMRGAFENAARTISDPEFEDCRRRMAAIVHDPACIPEAVLMMQLTQYARPDRADYYIKANRNRVNSEGPIGYRIVDRLEELALPVLVVAGREDPRANWRRTEAAVARMPDAELHIVDECGHVPHIEHPAMFNRLATEFLSR